MKEKDKMFFYESFAEEFDSKMNMYDTNKRIQVIFEELLPLDLSGKEFLDAGCGTGWFSKKACEKGAQVSSMDLGPKLLEQVKKKCTSRTIEGSILEMPFEDNTFDIVVSSEVIEHTPDPGKAIAEIYRVLKPGGIAVVTTPNKFWYFSLLIANILKLRPYQGLENWSSWGTMRKHFSETGFDIQTMIGIHAFPFVVSFLNPILDFLHRYGKELGPCMVNIAVKAVK